MMSNKLKAGQVWLYKQDDGRFATFKILEITSMGPNPMDLPTVEYTFTGLWLGRTEIDKLQTTLLSYFLKWIEDRQLRISINANEIWKELNEQ